MHFVALKTHLIHKTLLIGLSHLRKSLHLMRTDGL